ncbi:MAG: Jag N-terminal domain-containing protein [Deltaproteobacteria bacterium]
MTKRKSLETAVLEFEGKNLDKAIEAACRHFSASIDQLGIEIVARGSTGIFGIMGGKARIRAGLLSSLRKLSAESTPPPPSQSELLPESPSACPKAASILGTVQESAPHPGPPEGFSARACEILDALFQKASLDASVSSSHMNGELFLEITGADISLVIGKDGQNLDAFEYILNRILAREFPEPIPVILDAGGYRAKREEFLMGLAAQKAEKVKTTGKTAFINPMSPADRRIIHIALRNDPDVRARSTGEGLYKRMVITPSKTARRSDPQPTPPSSASPEQEPPSGA